MYKTELMQANHHFNEGEHKEAAELYTIICLHRPLHEVPKKTLIAASRTLGFQLSNGIGIEKNPRRAVQMYRIAVALDDPASTCNLASMWFDGVPSINKATKEPSTVVLRQDPIRGANLLGRLLSRVSYVPAIVELGRCYFTGEGVAFDPARATELWTRAEKLAISGKTDQTKEELVPAIAEAQRALKEVRMLGANPKKFADYQEQTLEENATQAGRYGPYTSPWGAAGYVQFLRSKHVKVTTVTENIR